MPLPWENTTSGTGMTMPSSGYTCSSCGSWVGTGMLHTCYQPFNQTFTCPICNYVYPQGTAHYCQGNTNQNYQLTQISTTISQILTQLNEMKKRLEKIEQILDDEL